VSEIVLIRKGYGHSMMNLVFRRMKLSSEKINMELGPLTGSPTARLAAAKLAKPDNVFLSLSIANPRTLVGPIAEPDGPEVLDRAPGM
jgi:hypothetical protein